ncbi:MAG TPA: SDR family oxidoreductase [Candidatus Baltobacteraceae bacterium]|nr:SDR family oxidoreductase [Candidatus Baltobacteraceae bacterium]
MNNGVLVTGASTGIGYACAQTLADAGFIVFAGVRSESDAQRLSRVHGNVRPVLLDVTMTEHLRAAAGAIRASGVQLSGVVNNAGIAVAGPLEFVPLEDVRKQFETNLFGALAVTQATLPLLRQTPDARIVFMSSVSGQIAPPFVGPYASSKFALEAMADALRMELSRFGIFVSVVQPGNVRTPIWQKGRDAKAELVARMPQEAADRYADAVDALVRVTEREERTGSDPQLVANAVVEALTARRPKARYPVGNPPAWQRRLAALLPEHVRDRLILRTMTRR